MKNTLPKLKNFLKKKLPKSFFDFILHTFRFIRRPLFYITIFLFFRKRKIVFIDYKDIKYKLILDPKNGFLDKEIFFYKSNDLEVLELFRRYIKKGNNVLDIGGNVGHHSLFLSYMVGKTGKIFTFEPIKRLAEQIKESASINSINNIIVNNFALGNKEEKSIINLGENHLGGSSILDIEESSQKEEISIKVLDILELPKIDFIKLDTEGFEWNVIKGGQKLIERDHPVILFEYNPIMYEKQNPGDAITFLEFFDKRGYSLYDIYKDPSLENRIENFSKYKAIFKENTSEIQTNILAVYN